MSETVIVAATAERSLKDVIDIDLDHVAEIARRVKVPTFPGLRIHVSNGFTAQYETDSEEATVLFTTDVTPMYGYEYYRKDNTREDFTLARAGYITHDHWPADSYIHLGGKNILPFEDGQSVPTVELFLGRLLVKVKDFREHEALMRTALIESIVSFMPEDHWVYRGEESSQLPKQKDPELFLPKRNRLGRFLHGSTDWDNAEIASMRAYRREIAARQMSLAVRSQLRNSYIVNLSLKKSFANLIEIL